MDEDVSKLTDEELDARIAGEEPASPEPAEEAPAQEEEPAAEGETQEEEAPQEPVEEEQPEEVAQEEVKNEDPEEKPPSRREQLRINKLLEKYGDPRQASPAPSQPKREDALDYKEAFDIQDPEVVSQLEADRQRAEQASYAEGLRRAEAIEWKTNIRLDLPLVQEKLDKLDARDVEALDKEYLYVTGFDPNTGYVQNPNVGYAEFMEARIEQAERLAKSMAQKTAKNIAKQAATTGLRPDGSSAKRLNLNKPAHEMSDEELDAKLKQAGFGTR